MIPMKSDPPTHRHRAPVTLAAALGALAVLATGCASGSADPVAAALAPVPPATAELTEENVNAWLDGLVPTELARTEIPGASISVVHEGELLTARGYGYADTGVDGDEPTPVDPEETLFRVGSVSKLFTATAVMQLVERGDVDLDTDIGEYLDFDPPTNFDEPITMRHLLTHTPGFEERIEGAILTVDDDNDLARRLSVDPPEQVYPPGTVPSYSNHGNALAGLIVEQVSGVPFDDYVQDEILKPLGMDSSSFAQPLPDDLQGRLAGSYPITGGPAQPFEVVAEAPAGALTASSTDMARFMLAHMPREGEEEILEPTTLEQMHAPALEADVLGTFAEGPRMTLGFFEEDRNGHRILGHGGDTQHFHSEMQILPEERSGIFVTLNGSGNSGMASHLLRLDVVDGFFDRYFPAEDGGGEEVSVQDTAAEHAAMAAGSYMASRRMESTFLAALDLLGQTKVQDLGDGTILVTPGPATFAPTVYEEVDPWVWRQVGGHSVLTMRPDKDGQSVEAIGFESAFTLLRIDTEYQPLVALPIIIGSVLILVVTMLSWPTGALLRRRASRPGRGREGRLARVLTRVGVGSAVAALLAWVAVVMVIMEFLPVPALALRAIQALQLIGILAILPAAWSLFQDVRRRAGWKYVVGGALVLIALLGVQWFAVTFGLLFPSITY